METLVDLDVWLLHLTCLSVAVGVAEGEKEFFLGGGGGGGQ